MTDQGHRLPHILRVTLFNRGLCELANQGDYPDVHLIDAQIHLALMFAGHRKRFGGAERCTRFKTITFVKLVNEHGHTRSEFRSVSAQRILLGRFNGHHNVRNKNLSFPSSR